MVSMISSPSQEETRSYSRTLWIGSQKPGEKTQFWALHCLGQNNKNDTMCTTFLCAHANLC